MSTTPASGSHKHPPRPPREATGPLLLHTPEGPPTVQVDRPGTVTADSGPAWVKAPPPRYHLEGPGGLATLQPVSAAAPPPPPPAPTSKVRCPKCKASFEWTSVRPTQLKCPHCGVKGFLK